MTWLSDRRARRRIAWQALYALAREATCDHSAGLLARQWLRLLLLNEPRVHEPDGGTETALTLVAPQVVLSHGEPRTCRLGVLTRRADGGLDAFRVEPKSLSWPVAAVRLNPWAQGAPDAAKTADAPLPAPPAAVLLGAPSATPASLPLTVLPLPTIEAKPALFGWQGGGAYGARLQGYARAHAAALANDLGQTLPDSLSPMHKRQVLQPLAQIAEDYLEFLWPQALRRFYRHLDSVVLRAAGHCGPITLGLYNHLWAGGDSVRKGRRGQAVTAYPLLARALVEDTTLGAAVDNGRPLVPLLQKHFACGRRPLKAINSLTVRASGRTEPFDPAPLLRALGTLPAGSLPQHRKDWTLLIDIVQYLDRPMRWDRPRRWWRERGLGDLGRDWRAYAQAILHGHLLDDVADVAEALTRDVILPALPREGALGAPVTEAEAAAISRLLAESIDDKPLPRQAALARDWHDRLPRRNALWLQALDEDGVDSGGKGRLGGADWLPLSLPYRAANGVVLQPLTSGRTLLEEGRAMKNCLGSYAARCARGDAHVLSLRDASGDRLSDALIETGTSAPHVAQHAGPRNNRPPEAARAALAEYMAAIDAGRIRITRGRRRSPAGTQVAEHLPASLMPAMFEVYRPLLPAPYRTADWAAFCRLLEKKTSTVTA